MKEADIRNSDVFAQYLHLVEEDARFFFSDKSKFIEVACIGCGRTDARFEFEKSGFNYLMCKRCATLYVNPRPSASDIVNFSVFSKSADFWVNKFFLPVAQARRQMIFKPRAELVNENVSRLSDCVVGDIGAGFGLFLQEFKKIKPKSRVIAIEPSVEMAKILKQDGIDTINSAIEDLGGRDGQFDVLTAFELVEHLFDPRAMFKKVNKMLKPKGLFFMTTLNCEGFDIQMLWERSKNIYPPQHINFFNPSSIKNVLEKSGFTVKEILTPGKLDWEIVEKAIKDGTINAGRFWLNFSRHATEDAKRDFQNWLSNSKLSSHMLVIAEK